MYYTIKEGTIKTQPCVWYNKIKAIDNTNKTQLKWYRKINVCICPDWFNDKENLTIVFNQT